jgi:hypothetical protein
VVRATRSPVVIAAICAVPIAEIAVLLMTPI